MKNIKKIFKIIRKYKFIITCILILLVVILFTQKEFFTNEKKGIDNISGCAYINLENRKDRKELLVKEFDKMKKTAFLINTSRGAIVNEDDLIIALSTNVILGAGLDVYEKEPLPEGNKLRFLPNALLTPHIGYVTAENYSIFYTQMIEDLEACVNGKPLRVIE